MRRQQWLRLLILTSSIALSSCKGTLPIRPEVDICMVSTPDQACLCAKPNGAQYVLPFGEAGCDKYVAFSPAQFDQLAEYILKIEQMAHKQCGLKSTPASDAVREFTRGYQAIRAGYLN